MIRRVRSMPKYDEIGNTFFSKIELVWTDQRMFWLTSFMKVNQRKCTKIFTKLKLVKLIWLLFMKCMPYSHLYRSYQMYIARMEIILLRSFYIFRKTFSITTVNIGKDINSSVKFLINSHHEGYWVTYSRAIISYRIHKLWTRTYDRKCTFKSSNIMILIKSGRSSFSDRFQLRRILNSSSSLNNFAFLIGTQSGTGRKIQRENNLLQMEMAEYDDIILADFHDTYENLPLKTKSMYKFAVEYCIKGRPCNFWPPISSKQPKRLGFKRL